MEEAKTYFMFKNEIKEREGWGELGFGLACDGRECRSEGGDL